MKNFIQTKLKLRSKIEPLIVVQKITTIRRSEFE